jgi:hypothetical protein
LSYCVHARTHGSSVSHGSCKVTREAWRFHAAEIERIQDCSGQGVLASAANEWLASCSCSC